MPAWPGKGGPQCCGTAAGVKGDLQRGQFSGSGWRPTRPSTRLQRCLAEGCSTSSNLAREVSGSWSRRHTSARETAIDGELVGCHAQRARRSRRKHRPAPGSRSRGRPRCARHCQGSCFCPSNPCHSPKSAGALCATRGATEHPGIRDGRPSGSRRLPSIRLPPHGGPHRLILDTCFVQAVLWAREHAPRLGDEVGWKRVRKRYGAPYTQELERRPPHFIGEWNASST